MFCCGGVFGGWRAWLEAIVKEDDVVAGGTGEDALREFFGGDRPRVEAADGPPDEGKACLPGSGGDVAGFEAHGGAEEDGGWPVIWGADDALGFVDLAGTPVVALLVDAEAVVVEGVVADGVAFAGDAFDDVGVLFGGSGR